MKKAVAAIAILLVILVGSGGYWFSLRQPTVASDPVDALPTDAALVISYPKLNQAWDSFEEQDYYELLFPVQEMQLFFSRNLLLDSLLRYSQPIKDILQGSTIWSSYHVLDGHSLTVLHAIKIQGSSNEKALKLLNEELIPKGAVSESAIEGTPVHKLVISEPSNVIFYTAANGLVLISTSQELLSESLKQLKAGRSLRDDPDFVNAINVAGDNVDASVFINYSKLPAYLANVLKPTMTKLDEFITEFASWTVMDLNMKPEGFALNGFTYASDSLNHFLSIFLKQEPQQIKFPEMLPANTASFVFYGISDVISFSSDYRNILHERGRLESMESKLDSLNSLYGVDLEANVLAWLGNSFGMCITQPQSSSFSNNSYWVFETRSEQLTAKLLGDLSAILAEKNGMKEEFTEINGVQIGKLHLDGVLSVLFGDEFSLYENPSYMIFNGQVVFAPNTASLTEYLQYVQADRTLGKELSFSRFAENLGSRFNVFTYHHLARSRKIFESYLNSDAAKILERNAGVIKNFEAIGTQLTSTGKSFYSSAFLKYNPDQGVSNELAWNGKMEAKAQIPPVFVKNHLNNEIEVLIQDELNNLYLFNRSGQSLFKIPISEPIKSKPMQVDAFKDGKLQYIFNTANFIYLVDRDGNVLDGYPVKLPATAETELAVFDYDADKDYRLLIACSNKRIYNYNIKGKIISGWLHDKAADATVHPLKHLLVDRKDYIVTGESNGKIHLLDRRGKNRVTVEKRVDYSKKNHLQVFRSSEEAFTGIYLTDEQGKIHRVALDGDIRPMDLGKFSPEHRFFVADLNNDGRPEFIFSDLNMLQVFNYKKEKVYEQRLDPSATSPFIVDLGKQGKAIGYCFVDAEQLVLYNSKGEMVMGFPLSGSSQFDVTYFGEEMLVTSAGANQTLSIQTIR